MKLEIKGVETKPILLDYARIGITQSQSVGFHEIHFEKSGNGINVNVIKTEENKNELISQNRNIDVLARKLGFVEEIMRFMACERLRGTMKGKPNRALDHVSTWLETYFNNGGKLDQELIKIICKTIGGL